MKSAYKKQLIVVGAIALLFCMGGVVLVVLGFRNYAAKQAFLTRAKFAEGKIIGFERWGQSGFDREDILYATVFFKTDDGQEMRFKGPSQDGLAKYKKGDEVRVLYNPDNPEDAKIDSFLGLWFGVTMFWTIGGGAIVIPLLTLWQGWKWVKRQDGEANA